MNLIIIAALVVTGQCYIITYDCSGGERKNEGYVDITETDPVDTVLFVFNNSHGDLRWMASLNGTNGDYLSQFFKSSPTEGTDYTHALKLAKILDLELLQLELVSPGELFIEDGSNIVTIGLSVICSAEKREVNEWKFKINIRSVNEFYPQFIGSPFRTAVSESVALGTMVFDIGSRATDLDAGHTNLTFAVAPYMITQFDGSGYVATDNTNKGTLVLTKALDFESFLSTGRTYMFVNVTATDDGGFTSATSVNVSVSDSNDQSIQLVYPDCARPCRRANYTVTINESFIGLMQVEPVAILAEDLDTLNDSVLYSLVDENDKEFFDIEESTGALFKTAPLVNDSFGYSIEVQVRAVESTDESHFIDFNVTVFIKERLPKPDWTVYDRNALDLFVTREITERRFFKVEHHKPARWRQLKKFLSFSSTDLCWLIIKPTVTSTLYLHFNDLKVGDGFGPDRVVVYDGACKDAPIHATLRGDTTRNITDISGFYVLLNLITDDHLNFRGFTMDFYWKNN